MNKHVYLSRLYLERSEKGIKPIALYTRHTRWLPIMETQDPTARDNLHIEVPETTGMDNGNDSINGLDATVALGGLEVEDNTNELLPSNQATLTALPKEIIDLHQQVEAREDQPAGSWDHIE